VDDEPFDPVLVLRDAGTLGELQGVRFRVMLDGIPRDAFAVRWRGRPYAYVNTCRHEGLELDFGDAHFFDEQADALVCCHHGARYDPATGACKGGPCAGGRLTPLALEQRGAELWCVGRGSDVMQGH
jgi:nitrite reductase/ring-hydroxylating ferredoxin subunit